MLNLYRTLSFFVLVSSGFFGNPTRAEGENVFDVFGCFDAVNDLASDYRYPLQEVCDQVPLYACETAEDIKACLRNTMESPLYLAVELHASLPTSIEGSGRLALRYSRGLERVANGPIFDGKCSLDGTEDAVLCDYLAQVIYLRELFMLERLSQPK